MSKNLAGGGRQRGGGAHGPRQIVVNQQGGEQQQQIIDRPPDFAATIGAVASLSCPAAKNLKPLARSILNI